VKNETFHFSLFTTKKGFAFSHEAFFGYFSLIAPTGQDASHAPQSMHSFSSTSYFASPSLIALVGHSPAHAPHEIHSSLMNLGMIIVSFFENLCGVMVVSIP